MNKTLSTLCTSALILAGGLSLAHADTQGTDKDFYLAPFGSYLQPGGDTEATGGWGVGLGVGKVLNEHFNVELRGFWQNYQNACCDFPMETDLVGATADLQYYFFRDTFAPYAVASVGGMTTDISSTEFTNITQESFIFEAGVGSTYSVYKNLMLRGDVRYRLNTLPDSTGGEGVLNDAVVNLGFVVPMGF